MNYQQNKYNERNIDIKDFLGLLIRMGIYFKLINKIFTIVWEMKTPENTKTDISLT